MKTTTPKAINKSKPKPKGRSKKCVKPTTAPQVTPLEPPADPITTPMDPTCHPPLTSKQQMFIKEYLTDFNATRAAKASGYSEKSARTAGRDNMQNPHIKAEIRIALTERLKRIEVTADRVVQEIAMVAFARMGDFVRIDDSGIVQAIPIADLGVKDSVIQKVKDKRVIRSTKGTENNPDGDQILDATFEFELCDKVKVPGAVGAAPGPPARQDRGRLKQPVQITIKKFCSRKTAKETDGSRATS